MLIYFLENSIPFNATDINSPKIAGTEKTLINITNELAKNTNLSIKVFSVFLSGFWDRSDFNEIDKITTTLRKNNINRIYLVGPSPRWHDPLPKILVKKYRLLRKIPEYLPDKNHKDNYLLDDEFSAFAKKNGLIYVSPMKILCKENYTCLTKMTLLREASSRSIAQKIKLQKLTSLKEGKFLKMILALL